MKQLLSIIASIAIISFAFTGNASVGMVKSALPKGDNNSAVNIVISSDEDVFGLQFDILFNDSELQFVNGESLLDGFSFHYKDKENGVVRGLLFSLEGTKLIEANGVANMVELVFEPKNNFSGSSFVEFQNVILAGTHGQEILVSSSGHEVSFGDSLIPEKTSLFDNFPNPFNPTTNIPFKLSEPGYVAAVIYDINGAEVRNLVSGYREAGSYSLVWNSLNNDGLSVSSGRYILKITAPNYSDSITMTLLK